MTPEEKQKADAWMLLQDGDVVRKRIMDTMHDVFDRPEVMRWISGKMVDAEGNHISTPLKSYFEKQLERNLRMILADGVQKEVAQILRPMIEAAMRDYAEQVSNDLKELKKLKSKGPIHARR
jgi:hypothetical protein